MNGTGEGGRIDPADWDSFGEELHGLLDDCLTRLSTARAHHWQEPPADMAARVALDGPPISMEGLREILTRDVMPFGTTHTHPKFWGWVHGTGMAQALASEMVGVAMNANLGGRHQGAVEVERAVVDWCARTAGLPSEAFGIIVSGTSQATVLAIASARIAAFGTRIREAGIAGLPPLRVYIAEGGHSCVDKALQLLGHGSKALRTIPVERESGAMDTDALRAAIAEDRAAGVHPFMIVGTAGSVNLGTYDDFPALADVAEAEGMWLHIDAAFGFWTRIAPGPIRLLTDGIERADSIAADFHKWMAVPYACGICLVRDGARLTETFKSRPDYLAQAGAGLAAGDLWFCDYGMELSRGFLGLKVWCALRAVGAERLGQVIADNCRQAQLMGALAEAAAEFDLVRPVVSNLCVFAPRVGDAEAMVARLQLEGRGVFSTTRVDGRVCFRAAIVNHRTTEADIREAMAAAAEVAR